VALSRSEIAGDEPTPALYVTIEDEAGGLIDLPFIFNLGDSFVRNDRDRTEFQSRIRGERLPTAALPARHQPWLSAAEGDDVAPDDADDPEDIEDPPVIESRGAPPDENDDTDDVAADPVDTDRRNVVAATDPPSDPPSADAEAEATEDGQIFASWPVVDSGRGPLSTGSRRSTGDRPGGINARRWRHTRGVDGAVVPEVEIESRFGEPVVERLPLSEPLDVVLAEWAGAEPTRAYAAWPGVDVAIDEQPVAPDPPEATAGPAYEKAARTTIEAVLFVISRRVEGHSAPPLTTVPPSSVEQAAALSELVELTAAGVITPEEARGQKARLIAVGEASVRLRTLLELSGAGHLSLTELLKKRDTILRGIDYPMPVEE